MKMKDLRTMSKEDLNSKLTELRTDMIKHNAQIATGTTPKSPGHIREIKKTIAKILTIVGTQKSVKEEKAPKDPEISEQSSESLSDSSDKKAQEKKPNEQSKASTTKIEEKING